jgi:SAM-dependent methyltransferase
MLKQTCPACGVVSETPTVSRNDLITMQNYIYRERAGAARAAVGKFELYFCRNCGLAFNAAYDAGLMSYDEGYTAYIPSAVFENYYRRIAEFLNEKFAVENKLVVDIACGKGNFLELLCETFPAARGLGIDPSYEPDQSGRAAGRVAFVSDVFREEYITEKPALVLCRHAFDQIEHPLEFLQAVRRALAKYDEVGFFIEVGDLEWMIENESFSDFCYERCSFFSAAGMENMLRLAGFTVEKIEKAFGGQYLWAYGTIRANAAAISATGLNFADARSIGKRLLEYSVREKKLVEETKARLQNLKNEGFRAAVWGIATKGVVFCNLIDADRSLFDYCIDINPQKSNCFVPHTGHLISLPDVLREAGSSKILIVVMNPNYSSEIADYCRSLNLNAVLMDAAGRELTGGPV